LEGGPRDTEGQLYSVPSQTSDPLQRWIDHGGSRPDWAKKVSKTPSQRNKQGVVEHACHPSYLGGRSRRLSMQQTFGGPTHSTLSPSCPLCPWILAQCVPSWVLPTAVLSLALAPGLLSPINLSGKPEEDLECWHTMPCGHPCPEDVVTYFVQCLDDGHSRTPCLFHFREH
jgi:hypothetical protein